MTSYTSFLSLGWSPANIDESRISNEASTKKALFCVRSAAIADGIGVTIGNGVTVGVSVFDGLLLPATIGA